MAIRIESNGLYLEGRQIPLYAGTVHYWRHAPEDWRTILEGVKELGFEVVSFPVPWGLHESGPGIFDFGEKNPSKGLPNFIDLCREIGLMAIVRIGPIVDEDMPYGGFPLRVIRNPALWAQTSTGAPAISARFMPPVAIPSYASDRFLQEAGKFLDQTLPILAPRQFPDGPIVLCLINKETAFFGRTQAYDLDYSPDSIALYRKFLSDKYGTIEALNEVYGGNFSTFTEIAPPKSCEAVVQRDLPRYLDWAEYKEFLILRFHGRLVQMVRDRGITVPLGVDGPPHLSTPIESLEMQKTIDTPLFGMEVDPRPAEYPALARKIRYLTGTGRLPFVSRFGAGHSWFTTHVNTPAEQEFAILSAVMHGMSAADFHMLAEGDRWVGAPIQRSGAFREEYAAMFRRLNAFFSQYRIFESKKNCRTLVLLSQGLERYHSAFSTLNHAYLGLLRIPKAFSDVPSSLGFLTEPVLQSIYEERSWIAEACRYLENAQVEYNLANTRIVLDELVKYDMVFVPTADFMDPKEQERLLEFADRGGHLVFGPALPTLDERMNPASVLGAAIQIPGTQNRESGKITFLPGFDQAKDLITPDMPNVVLIDNPHLRLTIRGGLSILVFLANPTNTVQRSIMISSWPLRGVWNAPEGTQTGSVTSEVPPYTVQVWEVLK
ncbi:MAG: beta-galactosidase [Anaerolineales bacterium]|nr:beta-galactosidase [Anaerolineales bacterium]